MTGVKAIPSMSLFINWLTSVRGAVEKEPWLFHCTLMQIDRFKLNTFLNVHLELESLFLHILCKIYILHLLILSRNCWIYSDHQKFVPLVRLKQIFYSGLEFS